MRRSLTLLLPALALIPTVATPRSSSQTDTIVAFHRTGIANDEDALREIERRASMEKKRLETRISWFERQRGDVDRLIGDAIADHQVGLDKLGRAAAWVHAHATGPDQRLHTPVGVHSPTSIDAARRQASDALDNARAAMAAGTYKVYLPTLGWRTGDQLDETIAQTRQQRDDLVRAVRDGKLRLNLIGLGRVDGEGLRRHIGEARQAIDDTLASIEAGTWRLTGVPFLGHVNRLDIDKLIATDAEAIAELKKSYDDRQLWIERAPVGAVTREKLEAQITGLQEAIAKQRDAHARTLWNFAFPAHGWMTGAQIRARMKGIDDTVADIRAKQGRGEYVAPVPGLGWTHANSVRQRIAALSGRTDQRSLDTLAGLQAALPKIADYAALHVAILQADLGRYARILALYPQAFEAWVAMKELEIEERAALRNEFERDLKDRSRQLEAHSDWLAQAIAAFLPQ